MAMKFPIILQPKSLQQRTTLFILLPTFLVLVVVGTVNFLLGRDALLEQWQQMAIANLQRGAHQVDMRLMRPKQMLMMLQQESGVEVDQQITSFILEQLRELDGVVAVNMEWAGHRHMQPNGKGRGMMMSKIPSMRFHRLVRLDVSMPIYDSTLEDETVSLITEFRDQDDQKLGHIEVVISFYDLIDQVVKAEWWQNYKALLLDQNGNVLIRAAHAKGGGETAVAKEKFGVDDPLEIKTLTAIRNNDFGTVFGDGNPPAEISGYCRLTEAPWTLVIVAPGKMVLGPIIKSRAHFIFISAAGILLVLLLIRSSIGKTTSAIRRVSIAANDLAGGSFGSPLQVTSRDEVGELTGNFNIMSRQLQERMQLQEAMHIAREVQQKFLPQASITAPGLEISGISIYCQETGGDYFDFLPDPKSSGKVHVVVGDVVGHGIGAALLMATIRALLRSRIAQPGSPAEVISDVNRLLCADTTHSGSFVTLFYLIVDGTEKTIRWIRGGHDPAIVYYPNNDTFAELKGKGVALGIDAGWDYQESFLQPEHGEQLICIGSDGVWDVENTAGERFGRERVKTLLAQTARLTAQQIHHAITEEIRLFRGEQKQGDDITLVIIKTDSANAKRSNGGG